jgi:ABC-type Co2+ transport system permease subunit
MTTTEFSPAPPVARTQSPHAIRRGYLDRVVAMLLVAAITTHAAVLRRVRRLQHDRGDIPGWAIAAGASVVFGLLVWAAVDGVVTNYIGKINSSGK